MSDSAVLTIATTSITIATMLFGFLTLWLKMRYGAQKAEEAVVKAKVVEDKLDANTATTNAVSGKTDTIVRQTNGVMDQTRRLIEQIAERVAKLEDYNRESSHRLLDVVNVLALKVERLLAMNDSKANSAPALEAKS